MISYPFLGKRYRIDKQDNFNQYLKDICYSLYLREQYFGILSIRFKNAPYLSIFRLFEKIAKTINYF